MQAMPKAPEQVLLPHTLSHTTLGDVVNLEWWSLGLVELVEAIS